MTVKLASALPKDDRNGLAPIATVLAENYYSGDRTTAVVVLKSIADNREKGERIPKVEIVRIEPVSGDLENTALDLLQDAMEQRLGRKPDTLDFDSEAEFADVAGPAAIEAGVIDAELVDDGEGGDAA